jgi:hypothetical protein
MEGDSAALGVLTARSLGNPLDIGGTTGGTNQRFLVPIRRDQNQRLRRAVLLNSPTSHGRPFWWGLARTSQPHPNPNLGPAFQRRKGKIHRP